MGYIFVMDISLNNINICLIVDKNIWPKPIRVIINKLAAKIKFPL